MKELKLYTLENKRFTYIIDELLAIGIYSTTTEEYLNKNDMSLLQFDNNNKIYRLNDGVLIRAMRKDSTRIDFLLTEDVCFESLELISFHAFNGEFYDEFARAFDMLETNQYEDEIWYD